MSSATARDDLMYRTTETYRMNVPEKQSALVTPRHMGVSTATANSSRQNKDIRE